jgi:hypothetical protein
MIIRLLGRDFKIAVVDLNEIEGCQGRITYRNRLIEISRQDAVEPLQVLLHELAHAWRYYTGLTGERLTDEGTVDNMGSFAFQLIIENGLDIYQKMDRWLRKQ